jgi:predicted AlkP superfamily phosphohydrolase/phosphomutase
MSWARRAVLAGALVAVVGGGTLACGQQHHRLGRRVIVLGFDGMDYGLTKSLMAQGRLPAFARLATMGSFAPLGTSIPPQSPVAWSGFITGLDPGGHGIFDFVHRDPKTMTPYLSTSRAVAADTFVKIGRYQFPLSAGRVELLRHGMPFWQVLESHGIDTTIVRMPANFPPSGAASRELSGMGTPDILGTYGTFSFYTSAAASGGAHDVSGGAIYPVGVEGGVVHATLHGPDNPFLRESTKIEAPFTVHVDATRQFVKLVVGDEVRLLRVGEWSDWVPLRFDLIPTQHLDAECRFFLKQLAPSFELYVSPLNIDPLAPALPISSPASYAVDLARDTGRFYSQGMPEDTKGLKSGVLSTADFLEQSRITREENERQYRHVLGAFDDGFLFYYFGHVDQVSHMMWRVMDPGHPAYNAVTDVPYRSVIEDLYVDLDRLVGETLARLGPDDLLIVMSDHGFASWRRAFNLNTWLRDHGYLTLAAGESDPHGFFTNVDWTTTRAYALGLNGLYVNLKGREANGVVEPAGRDALVTEISAALLRTIDPKTGLPAVTRAFRREQAYPTRGFDEVAPDVIVGYAKGTRTSDDSALGGIPAEEIVDNLSAWSGDHCMDPDTVPGILLTSHRLARPTPTLQSLAPAILAELGVAGFPGKEH